MSADTVPRTDRRRRRVGARGSHSRDGFTAQQRRSRRASSTSYIAGRQRPRLHHGRHRARNEASANRTRGAPRRCTTTVTTESAARSATPAHRIAGANDSLVRHGGATIGALRGEPVEDASPERRERVGRPRRRETASATVPTRRRPRRGAARPFPRRSAFARRRGRGALRRRPTFPLGDRRRQTDGRQTVPDDAGERRRQRRRRCRRRVPLALRSRRDDERQRTERRRARRAEDAAVSPWMIATGRVAQRLSHVRLGDAA